MRGWKNNGMLLQVLSLLAALLAVFGIGMGAAVAADAQADEHAHHHHHAAVAPTTRSTAQYQVPDVNLVREDGQRVSLPAEMNDGRPVVLAFIYTSCTTVCPLTSATLEQLQDKLGDARGRVHLMSISIDPEYDTPQRLRDYAHRFHAGAQWQHYTGTLAASRAAQQAFDVYRGSKMDHAPVVLVRTAPGSAWVRLDGFATADQLLAELSTVRTAKAAE
jgi:protein SCO1/2